MSLITWSLPWLPRLLTPRSPAVTDRPTCPHCGARVSPTHTSCWRCGTPQLAALQRGRPRRPALPATVSNHQVTTKFPLQVRAWNWWQAAEIL